MAKTDALGHGEKLKKQKFTENKSLLKTNFYPATVKAHRSMLGNVQRSAFSRLYPTKLFGEILHSHKNIVIRQATADPDFPFFNDRKKEVFCVIYAA